MQAEELSTSRAAVATKNAASAMFLAFTALSLIAMLFWANRPATAAPIIININGLVSDNRTGMSGSVHYSGEANFTLLTETRQAEQWSFDGVVTETTDPIIIPIIVGESQRSFSFGGLQRPVL